MGRTANIILCKCDKEKTFGIRAEKIKNDWLKTWAFKISDKVAKNEGYDKVSINGSLISTDEYPGCPYCETHNLIICGQCQKMNCYHGEKWFICHWCGNTGEIEAIEAFNVEGGGY